MSKIALLFITDGRKHHAERTLGSLITAGGAVFDHSIVVDDGLSTEYSRWLDDAYVWDQHLAPEASKRGFDGAIRAGWEAIPDDVDYVFHLEDDFLFNKNLPLASMIWVLEQRPEVVQVALMRQPWNEEEVAAGGVPQRWGFENFEQHHGNVVGSFPDWYEHTLYFTTNPCVYRRNLTERGWPKGEHSEGRFGLELRAEHPEARFAFFGHITDKPWVEHIGGANGVSDRTGINY